MVFSIVRDDPLLTSCGYSLDALISSNIVYVDFHLPHLVYFAFINLLLIVGCNSEIPLENTHFEDLRSATFENFLLGGEGKFIDHSGVLDRSAFEKNIFSIDLIFCALKIGHPTFKC